LPTLQLLRLTIRRIDATHTAVASATGRAFPAYKTDIGRFPRLAVASAEFYAHRHVAGDFANKFLEAMVAD